MKSFWRNSIRTCLATVMFPFVLTKATLAQDIKVPFLFSDDEKLAQTELQEVIPRSSALQSDPYLNAPITRLEYMLTKLESRLNDETTISLAHRPLTMGFEINTHETPVSITGFARYDRDIGRVVVGYRIEKLGRPKRPMRTTCDELLFGLQLTAPQANLGFLMHHTVLGVLAQEDFSKYTPIMETVAKSVVHRVIIQSQTEDLGVTHALACQKTEKEAPIQYHRYSFKLSRE